MRFIELPLYRLAGADEALAQLEAIASVDFSASSLSFLYWTKS